MREALWSAAACGRFYTGKILDMIIFCITKRPRAAALQSASRNFTDRTLGYNAGKPHFLRCDCHRAHRHYRL